MAGDLAMSFEKRYPGGAAIEVKLQLSFERSPIVVLFGPSGAGKTTILRCLAGLDRPEAGSIRYDGQTWVDAGRRLFVSPQRRSIGYMFQTYSLFPHLTVRRNIGFGLRSLRSPLRERRVSELLDLLQLKGIEERYPHQLSGGQAQRVALARALAPKPKLLLLDEPISALDAPTREQVRAEIRLLLTRLQVPTLVVTHDRAEALSLGDQLIVLVDGRILQAGTVEEVFSHPADVRVAQSVGMENIVAARVVDLAGGLTIVQSHAVELVSSTPAKLHQEVFACVRAEEVMLEKGRVGEVSARNRLAGKVAGLQSEGPLVRVTVNCGIDLTALVTRQTQRELSIQEGDAVTALIKAPSVHLIFRNEGP